MHRLIVRLRWWLRAFRRWITGRSAMLPRLMPREALVAELVRRAGVRYDELLVRRKNNRDLLTGMAVALIAGPNRPLYSDWEYFRAHAGRQKSNYKKWRDRARLVGKPLVTEYPNHVKIGVTEWWQDYVPRKEQLAQRRAEQRALSALRMAA